MDLDLDWWPLEFASLCREDGMKLTDELFMLAFISAWVTPPDTMLSCGGLRQLGYEILLDTWASDSSLSEDTTSAAP